MKPFHVNRPTEITTAVNSCLDPSSYTTNEDDKVTAAVDKNDERAPGEDDPKDDVTRTDGTDGESGSKLLTSEGSYLGRNWF